MIQFYAVLKSFASSQGRAHCQLSADCVLLMVGNSLKAASNNFSPSRTRQPPCHMSGLFTRLVLEGSLAPAEIISNAEPLRGAKRTGSSYCSGLEHTSLIASAPSLSTNGVLPANTFAKSTWCRTSGFLWWYSASSVAHALRSAGGSAAEEEAFARRAQGNIVWPPEAVVGVISAAC